MRASMSLVRSWLRGIGVFIAMTTSFCIAMTIAISGPPTASEMTLLQSALTDVMGDLGRAAREAGAEACADMPADAAALLCVREAVAVSTKPPLVVEPPPLRRVDVAAIEPAPDLALPVQPRDLLGARDRTIDEGAAVERPARAQPARPARRAHARPTRERRGLAASARPTPRRSIEVIREIATPLARLSNQTDLEDVPTVALSELQEPDPVEEVSAYEQDWPDTDDRGGDDYEDEPTDEDDGYYPDPYEVWEN